MLNESNLKNSDIELFTRADVAKLLKIGVSHVDLLSENELPKIRIGKSVRYRRSSIQEFIKLKETKKAT